MTRPRLSFDRKAIAPKVLCCQSHFLGLLATEQVGGNGGPPVPCRGAMDGRWPCLFIGVKVKRPSGVCVRERVRERERERERERVSKRVEGHPERFSEGQMS